MKMNKFEKKAYEDYKAYLIREGVDKDLVKTMARVEVEYRTIDFPDCIFEEE